VLIFLSGVKSPQKNHTTNIREQMPMPNIGLNYPTHPRREQEVEVINDPTKPTPHQTAWKRSEERQNGSSVDVDPSSHSDVG